MSWLFVVDGSLFVLIGLVVLATPSPQPALVRPVDDVALQPFKETRRLLASQFIGNGLWALVFGLAVTDPSSQRLASLARVGTIALVLVINTAQLAKGAWKKPPLYVVTASLGCIALGYVFLLLRATP
jgi:hypothetical protein